MRSAANARTHSDAQVAQIAASIAEFGFVNPVLVDAAGVLVAGHGRVLAAKRLGLVSVPAIRLTHLTEAQARALRLADNQIATMLQDGFASADADMAARSLRESRVEAERMTLATRAALAADSELLEPAERDDIERLLIELSAIAAGTDHAAIDTAVERLGAGTEAFAAARMNRGIQAALTGRKLNDL